MSPRPGGKTYGRLAVLGELALRDANPVRRGALGLRAAAQGDFFDRAAVPRAEPLACDPVALEKVTEAAFGQRRKMLRQSLKSLGIDALALLAPAGVAPTARAEEIPVEGFARLANIFAGIK